MGGPDLAAIQAAAVLLRRSQHAVAFTGAGISTPSGIPDFRSPGSGMWMRDDPMQVCSLTAFRRRPEAFFNWLRPLAKRIGQAEPNPAHLALAQLEKHGLLQAVITQNIDGLHQRAGSREVIELHGTTATYTCTFCRQVVKAETVKEDFLDKDQLPSCPHCRHLLKPDFVMFEESLPVNTWNKAEAHIHRADLVLVIGTALEVYPASMLPAQALEHGAKIVINTLSSTYLDDQAELLLRKDAAVCMAALVEELGL